MTVSSTTTKNSYSGNGSTTTFAYGFKIFANTDLTVILRSALGAETVQTLTTHYTVSNVGVDGGGNVVFVAAPASGVTVVIRRNMALTQSTDYVANDPFPAATHEDALDRLTFISQQIQEEVNRSIKLSRTNTMTSTEFTTSAADRANKILAFDTSGELAVTQELGTYKGTDTTTTTAAYNVRDIIKSTTAGQLNNVYICIAISVIGDTLTDTDHFELLVDAYSAASSAAAAASSATDAQTAQTAAELAETNAETAETNAAASEANAAASEANAATSESNAATSESNASTSESNASTSASTATTQAGIATTQAGNASTSASNAATSESNAATSESNAATSESNAATSETNAATSASNAATSESNASTSETNAAASAAAAAASADTFDDTYLGSKSSDPSVDNDGDALNAGDLYFNTTSNTLKVYTGSAWQDAAIDSSGFVQTTGDTMTGALVLNSNLSANGGAVFNEGSADVDFRVESNGNANMLFVDGGNDRVGVGGTPTAYPLEIYGANGDGLVFKETTNSVTNWFGGFNSAGTVGTLTNHPLTLVTNATERMRITSAGNVGIGTTVPASPSGFGSASILHLKGSASNDCSIVLEGLYGVGGRQEIGVSGGDLYFNRGAATGSMSTSMIIKASGNVGIGTSSPASLLSVSNGGAGGVEFSADASYGYVMSYNRSGSAWFPMFTNASEHRWGIAGTQKMMLNSSGNVGIGTSSPTFAAGGGLQVKGSDFTATRVTGGSSTGVDFAQASDGTAYAYNRDNMPLIFGTNDAERMRIHSSGRISVGSSATPSSQFQVHADLQAIGGLFVQNTNGATGGAFIAFLVPAGGAIGSISNNNTSVAYNTSSDYRLKENVVTDWDATTRLKQLKPSRFNFIADADTTVDGFLAHEVQSIVPEAITGTKDALDADGNPDYQGIDQSKLVPLLVKTIQELEARITALENGE
jgi:hypothetical protein